MKGLVNAEHQLRMYPEIGIAIDLVKTLWNLFAWHQAHARFDKFFHKFQKILEDSELFQNIWSNSKRFQKIKKIQRNWNGDVSKSKEKHKL